MSKLINDTNIAPICSSIESVDTYSLLREILAWQDSLDTDWDDSVVYSTLETVIDIILDNATYQWS